ncbi:MAG: OadG family protein [Desulfobulbus sp.]|nr:OadG family protein [Desulfobulbus sp.]
MIVEGVKLTLLGVGVVYLFLSLLVVVIKLSSRILKPLTDKEEATYNAVPTKKAVNRRAEDEQQRIMAVITAAIAAHRTRQAAASSLQDNVLPPSRDTVPALTECISSVPLCTNLTVKRRSIRAAGSLYFKDRLALRGFFHKG